MKLNWREIEGWQEKTKKASLAILQSEKTQKISDEERWVLHCWSLS